MDFLADPAQGYFVDYRVPPNEEPAFGHSFCGPQSVEGAWCPNCQKPLLRFLALDTRDPRLNLQGSPFPVLSLLFCWTCNIAQATFFYRVLTGSVELLKYGQGGTETDFPYEDYPVSFPGARAVLQEITAEEQELLALQNNREKSEAEAEACWTRIEDRPDLNGVRHQVGGQPFLIQHLEAVACPVCGSAMPFLASVADGCLDPRGLAGDDGVQVLYHYCRPCHVTGVYQMYG